MWTDEKQAQLDGLNEALALAGYTEPTEEPTPTADPEPQPEPKPREAKNKPAKAFEPSKRGKNRVFLKIRKGTKFDPNTGKPIGVPYVQSFSYGEWLNFSKNFDKLGYTVMEVLYDPYGEAKKMFNK